MSQSPEALTADISQRTNLEERLCGDAYSRAKKKLAKINGAPESVTATELVQTDEVVIAVSVLNEDDQLEFYQLLCRAVNEGKRIVVSKNPVFQSVLGALKPDQSQAVASHNGTKSKADALAEKLSLVDGELGWTREKIQEIFVAMAVLPPIEASLWAIQLKKEQIKADNEAKLAKRRAAQAAKAAEVPNVDQAVDEPAVESPLILIYSAAV